MKRKWQTKKLHQVCKLLNGRAYNKSELLDDGRYPVLRVGNFFTNNHWYYSDLELEESKYCDTGDLLYAWSASFGPRIWTGGKAIFHYHIWKVVHDHKQVDKKYLFYFFQWDTEQAKAEQGAGTTMLHVSMGSMNERDIQIPPLPEQQRIVALLDEAFAGLATAKANAERNLQNARAVFESHLAVTFSQRGDDWAEMSLDEVVDPSCTLSYGIVQPGEDHLDGLPVVRPTDLASKVICLEGLKRIDPRRAEGYRRTALQGSELLLCVRGSTGVVSIAAPELRGANVTRGIVPVRFNPDLVLPELGYYLMKSGHVQSQIREKTYGAALMQINIRDLRAITLFVPSLKEQSVMALTMSELDAEVQHLTHLYERKLAALEELKQSLLQQAFNGEL